MEISHDLTPVHALGESETDNNLFFIYIKKQA